MSNLFNDPNVGLTPIGAINKILFGSPTAPNAPVQPIGAPSSPAPTVFNQVAAQQAAAQQAGQAQQIQALQLAAQVQAGQNNKNNPPLSQLLNGGIPGTPSQAPVNVISQILKNSPAPKVQQSSQPTPQATPNPQAGPAPSAQPNSTTGLLVHPEWEASGGYLSHGLPVPGRTGTYGEQLAGNIQGFQASGKAVPAPQAKAYQAIQSGQGEDQAAQVARQTTSDIQNVVNQLHPGQNALSDRSNTYGAITTGNPWTTLNRAGLNPDMAGPGQLDSDQKKSALGLQLLYKASLGGNNAVNVVERKLVPDPGDQNLQQEIGGNTDPGAIEAARQQYYQQFADKLHEYLQGGASLDQAKAGAQKDINPNTDKTTLQQVHNERASFDAQDRAQQAQALVTQIQTNIQKTLPAQSAVQSYSQQIQDALKGFTNDPVAQNQAIQKLFSVYQKTTPGQFSNRDVSKLDPQLQSEAHAWNEQLSGNQQPAQSLGLNPAFALGGEAGASLKGLTGLELATRATKGVAAASLGSGALSAADSLVHGQNVPQGFLQGATNPAALAAGATLGPLFGGKGTATTPVEENITHNVTPEMEADLKQRIDAMNGVSQNPAFWKEQLSQRLQAAPPEANPRLGDYKPAEIQPGDYEGARIETQQRAPDMAASAIAHAYAVVDALPQAIKSNWDQYAEGLKKAPDAKTQNALDTFHQASDLVHGIRYQLGEAGPHIPNFWIHNWQDNPARTGPSGSGGGEFQGYGGGHARLYKNVQEGQQFGEKLKNPGAPERDIMDWGKTQLDQIQKLALKKYATAADRTIDETGNIVPKPATHSIDLGNGTGVPLSEEGTKQFSKFTYKPNTIVSPSVPLAGKVLKRYDKVFGALRQSLLTGTQFHTVRLARSASSYLLGRGRPILAARAAVDPFLAQASPRYNRFLQQERQPLIEPSSKIGFSIEGRDPLSIGDNNSMNAQHTLMFGKGVPAISAQVAKDTLQRLNRTTPLYKALNAVGISRKPVDLNSPEARQAGATATHMMGFLSGAKNNISPGLMAASSRAFLGGSYRPSRIALLADMRRSGVGGGMARRAVASNYLGDVGLMAAAGAATGQKSDNLKDLALRGLVSPAIPTPWKDAKGNNIQLGLPANYISELGRIGLNLGRDSHGHIILNPASSLGQLGGNLANYGRNTLNIAPAWGLRIATNQDAFGNPVYSNSQHTPLLNKIGQAAGNLVAGSEPIPVQGFNKAGALGALANFLGLRPGTDVTQGRGLELQQGFAAQKKAAGPLTYGVGDTDPDTGSKIQTQAEADRITKGLQSVFDLYTNRNADWGNDEWVKSVAPGLIEMMLHGGQKGQEVLTAVQNYYKAFPGPHDPLWDAPNDQLNQTQMVQALKAVGADQLPQYKGFISSVETSPWYQKLQAARNAYFAQIPPSAASGQQGLQTPTPPTTPYNTKAPEWDQYLKLNEQAKSNQIGAMGLPPMLSTSQQGALNQFEGLQQGGVGPGVSMTGKVASAFLKAHPDLAAYFNYTKAASNEETARYDQPASGSSGNGGKGYSKYAKHAKSAKSARPPAAAYRAKSAIKFSQQRFNRQTSKLMHTEPVKVIGLPRVRAGHPLGLPFMSARTPMPVDTSLQNVGQLHNPFGAVLNQLNPQKSMIPDFLNVTNPQKAQKIMGGLPQFFTNNGKRKPVRR